MSIYPITTSLCYLLLYELHMLIESRLSPGISIAMDLKAAGQPKVLKSCVIMVHVNCYDKHCT